MSDKWGYKYKIIICKQFLLQKYDFDKSFYFLIKLSIAQYSYDLLCFRIDYNNICAKSCTSDELFVPQKMVSIDRQLFCGMTKKQIETQECNDVRRINSNIRDTTCQ